MTLLSLGLVLVSALSHTLWNFLAKRSQDKFAFMWLMIVAAEVFYLPLFWWVARRTVEVPPLGWLCVIATGCIYCAYFSLLGATYEHGDLSLTYPLSRGLAAILVPILATTLLGERLSLPGIAGILVIVAGIYVLHLESLSLRSLTAPWRGLGGQPSRLALLTGVSIALYSLVDKKGVSLVPPAFYIYLTFLLPAVLLAPRALGKRGAITLEEWQRNRWNMIASGILCITGYLLVLIALTISPVSYVLSARSLNVVFGSVLGRLLLNEPYGRMRIGGSLFILLGVILVGLAK